ncbi:tetratricopeptide repeat protein [Bhargavaea massiliensis]|uniref:tetratricopeptide repeat protein n=1 Tax=Bhargavaea massiliensis TaxID=2697500 RepID=UPI001BD071AE|nr:tetratricopeptide repeat protein [Bhargavaea massiliensis]
MNTKQITQLLDMHQYQDALTLLAEAFQNPEPVKLSAIREFLDQPEETIQEILTIMDAALMSRWGRIVARYSHRKLKTPNTLIWYCQELIDENKLIEAEELLKKLEKSDLPAKTAEKLYFNMADLLIRMRRFNEGCQYLEKCAEVTTESMAIRESYYYLYRGEWAEAVQLLEDGKQDEKNGEIAYAVLAQHYSLRGDYRKAELAVNEGLNEYPFCPKLLAEKIRILYAQKYWPEMRETIAVLNKISPFHDYRKLFGFYEAVSFYKEQSWGELEQFLTAHPELRQDTLFKRFSSSKAHLAKQLSYRQVVQNYNYCLPASAEMLLSMFSAEITQDEIAEAIFENNGSQVSKVISFFRETGYHSVLFHGNEERYKKLVDLGAGVLITIDYPIESHVQVLTGYDDHLEVFTVQDPNFREVHTVDYEELDKEFGNNHALSLAVLPVSEKDKLEFLDESEHEIAGRMLLLTENCDQPLSLEDTEFLRVHMEHPIVAIYSAKYLSRMTDKNMLDGMIQVLKQTLSDSVYRDLVTALAYVQANEGDLARNVLEGMTGGSRISTYWYLLGRLSADKGEFQQAAGEFRRAAELEPADSSLWSYQAISVSHAGDLSEGLRLSEIALDINGADDFALVNHGIILFDAGRYEEARNCFTKALRIKKNSAHIWYERARCDLQLDRYHQAKRGFAVAISLEPANPQPYRELALIYELVHEDAGAGEATLRKGLEATGNAYLLLVEMGELGERSKNLEMARSYYTKATEKEPENPEAWVSLANLIKEEGNLDEFFMTMNGLKERFGGSHDFLINGGNLICEAAGQSEDPGTYMEQGLAFMEEGIRMAGTSLHEALELYTGLIRDSLSYRRGIKFLEDGRNGKEDNRLFLFHAGVLYGDSGHYGKAKKYLEEALERKEEIQTLSRLGDVHFKMEDNEQAILYYKRVLKLDPSNEQAFLDLASVANKTGNQHEELHYLLEAFKVNPYAIPVEMAAGLMDQQQLRKFLSDIKGLDMETFDEAFLYDSMATIYGKLGQLDREEEYLAKALEASPEMPHLLHQQAKFLFRKGEQKQARKLLLQLIENHADEQEFYETLIEFFHGKSLGKLKTQLGALKLPAQEISTALMYSAAALEKVVVPLLAEQNEKQGVFKKWIGAAQTTLQLGVLIDLYETAIQKDRENIQAAVWFADFYMAAFLVGDAIKTLETALSHHWDDDLAYKLVLLYIHEQETFSEKKRERHLLKAQSLLHQLQSRHQEPEYVFQLGFSLFLQGDYPKAEGAYLECLKLDPATENAYFFLGKIYSEMEQYPKAEQAMKKAIEQAPEDPDVWNELGIIYRMQDKTHEALHCIEHATALHPDDLFFQYNRACYLSLLGRFEESSRQLERVFELDEEEMFLELSHDDEDLEPLKQAGHFPLVREG